MAKEILEKWLNDIASDYKAAVPSASGRTKNNTTVEVDEAGGRIKVPEYNYWLIHGRKPNKDQSKDGVAHFMRWAGYYLFTPWVKQKGLTINPYVVAWKVATKGYESKINIDSIITPEKKATLLKSIGSAYTIEIKLTINEIWQ